MVLKGIKPRHSTQRPDVDWEVQGLRSGTHGVYRRMRWGGANEGRTESMVKEVE